MKHEIYHGDADDVLRGFLEPFIVLREAVALVEPGKGSLDDPALSDHLESPGVIASLHDVEQPAAQHGDHGDKLPGVAAIGVYTGQPGPFSALLRQQQEAAVAVLHRGRQHHHGKDEPERVDEQMALGPLDLLARVVAPVFAPFSVVFALCESTMAALGHAFRPSASRTLVRSASCMDVHNPVRQYRRK